MKIAVWISFNYAPKVGGSFSYADKLIKNIDEYCFSKDLDICFATTQYTHIGNLRRELIRIGHPLEAIVAKFPFIVHHKKFQGLMWRLFSHNYNKYLIRKGIKLLFYSSQFERFVKDFPFVAPHWDIAHRSTFAFPEFSIILQDIRDKYYSYVLPRALMIFVESEAGKKELIRYTNLNEERIKVVPLFAGECTRFSLTEQQQSDILKSHGLEKGKFFFYPAQFIAEKNHYNVVKAFSYFIKNHPDYKLIFTGNSPKSLLGNIGYVRSSVEQLGLLDKVVFGGFVSLETIYSLYKNACALIMASYVGPTNMPPLEAMSLGCPVICSDLSGHREEMRDSALYFDAKDYTQLLEAMEDMTNNREIYLNKIIERSKVCEFTVESTLKKINDYLLEASVIRRAWE